MWRTLRAGKAQGRVPMRYAVVAAVLLTFTPSLTLAQAPSSADVNHAIDAAERICLVGNRYKFQVDASGNLTISKLLPGAAANVTVDRAEAKGSQFFENEEVRRLVDQDIRDCMKGQWAAVLPYLAGLHKQPYTKIACIGQFEGNCPGPHDFFYTCGYFGPDEQIAAGICQPSQARRIKTVSGDKCGYGLVEITCAPQ